MKATIVLVDDLAELRRILRLILEHGGPFRVVGEGATGEEAVALAAEHHPDLLLMDVEMPGGPSGWHVLPRIREVAPETAVVILSGSRADPAAGPARELAAAVLEKGLPPNELNAALLAVLGAGAGAGAGDARDDEPAVPPAAPPDAAPPVVGVDAFAAVAGHDLAQPLQVAYGYLEMLRADYGAGLDPTAATWLDAALTSLERMRVLVQDLLRFARTGATEPAPEEVDLGAAIDEALAALGGAVLTEVERDDDLPLVVADHAALVDVLAVLLDNARTFGGSRVTVSAETTDDEWVVAVTDDGPGVPPSVAARLFEPFQRGTSPERGSGLGLARARKLVEAGGGRLWLEPAPPDGSTTFRFSLPRPAGG